MNCAGAGRRSLPTDRSIRSSIKQLTGVLGVVGVVGEVSTRVTLGQGMKEMKEMGTPSVLLEGGETICLIWFG